MTPRDTIAAIATAPGRAGIGVVRVSGRDLSSHVEGILGRSLPPRRAVLVPFLDAAAHVIDEGIALYFPGPASYTGEDVLELHGHGGPVILQLLLQRCLELGARVAEPGEFTRRAYLSGKLDLAQAEGVIDLINATTAQAARCAVRSLKGEFSQRIDRLVGGIVELRTLVEATLDFPEEEIDFLERGLARERLEGLRAALTAVLEAARQGSVLRDGLHIVLAGPPNVGKSSLLNRLAGEELAIVTDEPGTTRDPIRQVIDLSGVPVHIIDTAGLRESADIVERLGVERAWTAIRNADAVVLLSDASQPRAQEEAILRELPSGVPRLHVMNKIDLTGLPAMAGVAAGEITIRLSAKTGEGVEGLKEAILDLAGWHGDAESAFLARERHLEALRRAAEHLDSAAGRGRELELFAEELRLAQEALSAITGEFTADDLLGEIFSRFCIGK